MIVDAIDTQGRRYLRVPAFPEGPLKRVFHEAEPERCVDCGRPVRHAYDRYYQRNDASDGAEPGLEGSLMGMTYDTVCGPCGDKLLAD